MNKKRWRKLNAHNFTNINTIVPFDIIKVGKMSYGPLNVFYWGNSSEKLLIGNYVSISSNVSFLLGGNHNIDTLSTYPFKVKTLKENTEAWTKGEVKIEDDVWIGMNATILSGVVIGQGSIIASNSVVTKSIPPYSIVAGNPSRIVRKRFNDKTIEKLIEMDFSLLDKELIEKNIDMLYEPLDLNKEKTLKLINLIKKSKEEKK